MISSFLTLAAAGLLSAMGVLPAPSAPPGFAVAVPEDAPLGAMAALRSAGAGRIVIGAPSGLSEAEALARADAVKRLAAAARAASLGVELVLRDGAVDPARLGVDAVFAAPLDLTATTGNARADALGIPYFDAPQVAARLRERGRAAILEVSDLARAAEPRSLVALNLALLGAMMSDPSLSAAAYLDRETGIDGAGEILFSARLDVVRVFYLGRPRSFTFPDHVEALTLGPADPNETGELRRRAEALDRAAETLGPRSGPLAAGLRRAAAIAHASASKIELEIAAAGGDLAAAFADLRRAGSAVARGGAAGELGGLLPRLLGGFREAVARSRWPRGAIYVPAEDLDGTWRHQTNIGGFAGSAFRCSNRRGGPSPDPLTGRVTIPRAGRYRVYARAYTGDGNDRSFSVAIGGASFPPTHRDASLQKYTWQECGRADLPAGEIGLEVRDAGEGWESVDALLVTPDVDFELADAIDPTAVFASEAEREAVFAAIYARHTPRRPLSRFSGAAEWEAFRGDLRKRVARACLLDPMPERPPLDVRVAHRLDRDGYSLERVFWQVYPGVHASGWLYRPAGESPPASRPAILNPHGHFDGGAKHPVVQSRCIALAKKGYVALAVDSTHVNDLASGLAPVGLMTWSNLRGLDLLESLPEVDRTRIGCTGASGGGQQTMYLMALDDRIRAAVPAVMITYFDKIISSGEDAHCFCNHLPGIVAEADETEMVAAFAPRPALYLCNTTDWTKSFPWDEFPDISRVYSLYGAADRIRFVQHVKEHDYDREMRELAYGFFERTLRGRTDLPRDADPEGEIRAEDPKSLAAVADPPPGVVDLRGAVAWSRARAERLRASLSDDERRAGIARLLGHVASAGRTVRGPENVPGGFLGEGFVRALVETEPGVTLPVIFRPPEKKGALVTVLAHPDGKLGALTAMADEIDGAIRRGEGVVCADLRLRGELRRNWTWNAVAWRRPEIGMAADDLLALSRWARAEWSGSSVEAVVRGDLALAGAFAAALGDGSALSRVRVSARDLPPAFAGISGTIVPVILTVAEMGDVVRLAGERLVIDSE